MQITRILAPALCASALLMLTACGTQTIVGTARCDGQLQSSEQTVDEGFDQDGDGYFDAAVPDCAETYPSEQLDCDDSNADIHPGADELVCNKLDDDCDPATLDSVDADGDGVAECNDCDDNNPQIHPDATEVCDGIDNNCDESVDNVDADSDIHIAAACGGDDCDDSNAQVSPSQLEQICNSIDDDCDPATLDGNDMDLDGVLHCEDCDDSQAMTYPGAPELCDGVDNDCNGLADADPAGEVDADADGFLSCNDCNDADGTTHTVTPELCDGLDNDCDGQLPANEADSDSDGYLLCGPAASVDCDDNDPAAHPGAVEIPGDGIDQDCDGVDEPAGPDIYVDGGSLYCRNSARGTMAVPNCDIQTAIDFAVAGEVIAVAEWTYSEVLIDVDIDLVGGFEPIWWNQDTYINPTRIISTTTAEPGIRVAAGVSAHVQGFSRISGNPNTAFNDESFGVRLADASITLIDNYH